MLQPRKFCKVPSFVVTRRCGQLFNSNGTHFTNLHILRCAWPCSQSQTLFIVHPESEDVVDEHTGDGDGGVGVEDGPNGTRTK